MCMARMDITIERGPTMTNTSQHDPDAAAVAAADELARKLQERKDSLKPMTLCEPCSGIQRNWRRAPGHAELVQMGNRKVERPHGLVTITTYRCDHCGTVWDYENNKVNLHAGWSVVGR